MLYTSFPSLEISPSPPGLEAKYNELFTPEALTFLGQLVSTFEFRVVEVLEYFMIKPLKTYNSYYILNNNSERYIYIM